MCAPLCHNSLHETQSNHRYRNSTENGRLNLLKHHLQQRERPPSPPRIALTTTAWRAPLPRWPEWRSSVQKHACSALPCMNLSRQTRLSHPSLSPNLICHDHQALPGHLLQCLASIRKNNSKEMGNSEQVERSCEEEEGGGRHGRAVRGRAAHGRGSQDRQTIHQKAKKKKKGIGAKKKKAYKKGKQNNASPCHLVLNPRTNTCSHRGSHGIPDGPENSTVVAEVRPASETTAKPKDKNNVTMWTPALRDPHPFVLSHFPSSGGPHSAHPSTVTEQNKNRGEHPNNTDSVGQNGRIETELISVRS